MAEEDEDAFPDDGFGDDDEDGFGDDDDGFGDDDGGFDDDGDGDDWGDLQTGDEIQIKVTTKEDVERDKQKELERGTGIEATQQKWTCLEPTCKNENPGGMMCLKCGKPNLGELDRVKRIEAENNAKFWFKHLKSTYLPIQPRRRERVTLDHKEILEIIRSIYAKEMFDNKFPDLKKWTDKDLKPACNVCSRQFVKESDDEKSGQSDVCIRESLNCHANTCQACFKQWILSKIQSNDIFPYIRCPAFDCECSIPFGNFTKNYRLSTDDFYRFCSQFAAKQLAANPNFVECGNGRCDYGHVFESKDGNEIKKWKCEACSGVYTLTKEVQRDEGFLEMLKEGKIRLCPCCEHPTMKDKGLCNVLQCGKCSKWWNWRTKEHAKTSKELKAKARRNRTLWEPGELEYQQRLQRENLPAFIELLARNGIKYDPHYRRGH